MGKVLYEYDQSNSIPQKLWIFLIQCTIERMIKISAVKSYQTFFMQEIQAVLGNE